MNIKDLQKNWDKFGKRDPLGAILWDSEKKENKWKVDEFFETGVKEIGSIMEYAQSLGLIIPRGKALDFGCGVGRISQALVAYFDEVIGVDIAPSMLRLAEKYNRFGNRCRYYLNATDDLTVFGDNSFDFIFTTIVLQHMKPEYSRKYLREFIRLLTPRGILIFQLPSEKIQDSPGQETRPSEAQHRESDRTAGGIKQLIKQVVPMSALRLYRNIRYGAPREPIAEMYGI
jgi:ubiquinone/menaquinone biosynthesis C-methylase UbiE